MHMRARAQTVHLDASPMLVRVGPDYALVLDNHQSLMIDI